MARFGYPDVLPGQVIYVFKVEASRTAAGVARCEVPVTRGVAEDDPEDTWGWVLQDALHSLRLLLREGHPTWDMSTDKRDWRAEPVGFDDHEGLWDSADRREWNLVPLKNAISLG